MSNLLISPMLASDAVRSKVRFPVIIQPKIDGVRGLNLGEGMTGRSLKVFANRYTTKVYSQPELRWFDGELAAESETHARLCSVTTSALTTIEGEPYTLWHLFDSIEPEYRDMSYLERLERLRARVEMLKVSGPLLSTHLRVIPATLCNNWEEVDHLEEYYVNLGYEGICGRDPYEPYKSGRSTANEGGLWRIKRFVDAEAVVTGIIEGEKNTNEAQINELGKTFRTTHQANMVPNGMVGALECLDCKTGKPIKVSAGKMTHPERLVYFQNPALILGKTVKYKTFPKGVKDKPRFSPFQSIRADSDIS